MGCWVYEGFLTAGIAFGVGFLSMPLVQRMPPEPGRHAFQALLFMALGIYFGWCWSRGQTLAMKTWRIRIVDRTGQPPSRARALLRYVLSWVWFLPPLALAALWHLPAVQIAGPAVIWIILWALASRLHPQRQFWHDAWAGTRLIDTRRPPTIPP
jgi:uncharacterized RDD family membrane protein YckC